MEIELAGYKYRETMNIQPMSFFFKDADDVIDKLLPTIDGWTVDFITRQKLKKENAELFPELVEEADTLANGIINLLIIMAVGGSLLVKYNDLSNVKVGYTVFIDDNNNYRRIMSFDAKSDRIEFEVRIELPPFDEISYMSGHDVLYRMAGRVYGRENDHWSLIAQHGTDINSENATLKTGGQRCVNALEKYCR